jgi:Tfp pilus assembly protein FimT
MVTVMIMSVAMAIVMPRFQTARAQTTVRSARQEIVSSLTTAKAAAIRRGRPATFHVSADNISVTVDQDGSQVPLGGQRSLDSELHVGVTSTHSTITFDARGFAKGLTADAILVVNQDGASDTVCVAPMGAIRSRGCNP